MSAPAVELPEQLAKRVTSLRTIVLAGLGLLGAGATAALVSQRYARAADVAEYRESNDKRVGAVEMQVTKHDALLEYIHADLEGLRDQEAANARAVGAPVIPRRHP